MAFAQTDKLPAGSEQKPATFYLKNATDTSAREVHVAYGGKMSDRLVRWPDLKNSVPSYTFGQSISSQPSNGDSPSNIQEFVNLYYKSNPPTGSISGSNTFEFTGTATRTSSFAYTYGKQAGTKDIQSVSIIVNGVSNPVTANAGGGSGNYSATYPTNQASTISLRIVTIDNKSATYSASIAYSPRIYAGTCAGMIPTSAEILAASLNPLSNSKSYTANITFTTSNVHVFFTYPSSFGTVTSIKDAAGNQLINAYTQGVQSFTNGQNYTQNYRYVVSNNTYSNTTITSTFQ